MMTMSAPCKGACGRTVAHGYKLCPECQEGANVLNQAALRMAQDRAARLQGEIDLSLSLEPDTFSDLSALWAQHGKDPELMPRTVGACLGYLAEEAAEVIGATGKSQRFGILNWNPKNGEQNRAQILRELLDLEMAIAFARAALAPRRVKIEDPR